MSVAGDTVHEGPEAHALPVESGVVRAMCPSGLPLFLDGSPRESGIHAVPCGRTVARMRLFAAVHVPSGYYELVEAHGVVGALEQVGEAPVGSLLIEDGQIGGIVRAEREEIGWVVTSHEAVSADRGRRC